MKSCSCLVLLALVLQLGEPAPRLVALEKEGAYNIETEVPEQHRQLLTITRNAIRITLDSSAFNTVTAGPSGTTTSTKLAFILRAMQVAESFFEQRIKVYPLSSLTADGSCTSDYTPSLNDQQFGIGASDLHIYMLYKTDASLSYGATGASCKYYGGSLPDSTLQKGRPVMGRIIFNTYNLVDQKSSLTDLLFQSIASTCIHETMHILGFDSTKFNTWLVSDQTAPNYGNTYSAPTASGNGTVNAARPTTTLLATPSVLAWARDFFNCSTLPGMLMENQDSTGLGAGSHWERTAMYDQLMTATALGANKYISGLTFAALLDMGWYTVDSTFADTTNYGYNKGCPFLLDACFGGTSFTEFCNAATQGSVSSCQTNYFGKSICSNEAATMADGCGIQGPYAACVDPTTSDSYVSYTQQAYGTSSFCVSSTLGTVALPSSLTSRCYPYTCSASSVTFKVGTYSITCQSGEAGTQKTLSSMTGTLTCPTFALFCGHTRKTCPNWCSRNGYCMGGVCNCLPGYYGSDCSKTTCTTGYYYSPLTATCVTVCPSTYYQNIYSRTCEKCDSTVCQECYGQPTICIGCISTAANPQYFYNSTCFSTCPAGTYASGFNCSVCDSAAYCATCSVVANNCTSCMYDAANSKDKYLSQPGYGTCIDSCPVSGNYTIADVVNKVCVNTCNNNLILDNNTCTYCPNGTYKLISNSSCVSNCPDYFYPDATNHLCGQCDSSCLTCAGPYAQNCTSCSPTATLRYWLLSMCWSICPGGYYANDTINACVICPVELHCGNCSYNNVSSSVLCSSCGYGYYYQSSSSLCTSACNTNQYANKANNTCAACNLSCASCSGPASSNCLSCSSGYLQNNLTGTFCLTTCSSVGYCQSGTSCLACDSSCYTCIGTAINECSSCPEGSFLSSSYCRLVCPAATYPDSATRQCQLCDGSCTYCFGPTIDNCTGCIGGMVLYNFTCRIGCPSGYTVNQWNVCFGDYFWASVAVLLAILGLL